MNAQNLNILLVEDNQFDQDLITIHLKESDFKDAEIIKLSRMKDATDLLINTKVDIILLDLSLPDSSGLEGLKIIATQYPETPTIIMTGLNDSETAVKAIKLGAQDFIVKGMYDGNLLGRIIKHAIERNKLNITLKKSEARLIKKIKEVERINRLMVDRELKMAQLKKQIQRLKEKPLENEKTQTQQF